MIGNGSDVGAPGLHKERKKGFDLRLRLGKKCGQVLVGGKRRGRRVGLDWIGMCKGGNEELEDDDNTL